MVILAGVKIPIRAKALVQFVYAYQILWFSFIFATQRVRHNIINNVV